ncbi:DUF6058 family natural product biosynthesis protein [Pseudoalteromonas luteoviolacea]|uniref:Orphan protein n=1 Tax=Pseudoalteromonas luteoviolacea S4054 TaxID=1129367 RepID=A0A0F6A5K8_9GAMM|nr:DUF6058 family natural product biosynthesis protein [Pseudoalteromonas luteoviolacea]AOT10536.1 hypothetical protein S4054249_21970 [Pseudoalteromonas luteoviolacea]AOT15396.1 hypothetical protein S40542_21625 [Pseudoalteromonas luteoviolacea]AOT20355.1 hypothetical protein S4054_21885 [Pseudoalteromonas luteoviolacea]KKE81487.1 hypothetical protein N479_03105 [Pseudoalteromonas luteoviolacea S4054]KZN71616.1 hypothetical protein N481_18275 [Pseudoalteromonas luteoviolacea S4047-1]
MRLSEYLKSNFYDANELCALIKIEHEQLHMWQENSIFPNASYSIENLIKCSSYLGLYECVEVTDYYPRGALDWGQMLVKHAVEHSSHAYELFQNKYITVLKACADKGVFSEDDKFGDDVIEHIQQVWQQFLCSKYGVISQNGTVEEVVFIDLGRSIVDTLTDDRTSNNIPSEHRLLLHEALKLLNKALSYNAAHEQQDSLRYKYIDSVIQKYDLSVR